MPDVAGVRTGYSGGIRHSDLPVLRVGCAMWAHPPWVGRFLSPGNKGNELREYAGWCTAVEGNTTFYAAPSRATVARWAEQAPPEFRFAFKLPRAITHERRLSGDALTKLAEFLAVMAPLHDRCGPFQIQLPPSFGPESLRLLTHFVARLPPAHRFVTELRHPGFFDRGPAHRALDDVLAEFGVGRVVLDTRPLYAVPAHTPEAFAERDTKPELPVLTGLVGPEPIVRVIGSDDDDVTVAGLARWVAPVVAWLSDGRRPFVFAHQPDNRRSPELARLFHSMVAAEVTDLAPLPEPLPVAPATEVTGQASLF